MHSDDFTNKSDVTGSIPSFKNNATCLLDSMNYVGGTNQPGGEDFTKGISTTTQPNINALKI